MWRERAGIQAGLGEPLTSVPLHLLTAKELAIKGTARSSGENSAPFWPSYLLGTVRYTPGCFADAISLLSRKKIDLKPLITSIYPLTKAADAFKAQHRRNDIKIIIRNQE